VNRTKDALQAAKARGTQLGNPRLAKALPLAVEANMEAAERFAANVVPIIKQIQASGVGSLRGVARALTALLTSLRLLTIGLKLLKIAHNEPHGRPERSRQTAEPTERGYWDKPARHPQ
jgi:DNA invertase Pin-like site-specific DNA recombinase